jgi:hypothetical protein
MPNFKSGGHSVHITIERAREALERHGFSTCWVNLVPSEAARGPEWSGHKEPLSRVALVLVHPSAKVTAHSEA